MGNQALSAASLHGRILWLTRTALLIALLIVSQAATAPLGSTLITGSLVNALLALSVILNGLLSGLSVALISPVIARLFGIGPQLWALLPFIAAGNAALVLCWHFIVSKTKERRAGFIAALIIAAIVKFLVLFLGVSKLAVPFLLNLPEKQAVVISEMFAVPQLITALFGGIIALVVYSFVKIAVHRR